MMFDMVFLLSTQIFRVLDSDSDSASFCFCNRFVDISGSCRQIPIGLTQIIIIINHETSINVLKSEDVKMYLCDTPLKNQ